MSVKGLIIQGTGGLAPCSEETYWLNGMVAPAYKTMTWITLTDTGLKCHTLEWTPRNRSSAALHPTVLYEHYQHDQDGFGEHEIHCQL